MLRSDWIRGHALGSVLDVGSYNGWVFRNTLFDVTSLDRDKYDIENFVQGGAQSLPFEDKSFDTVVLAEILEHIDDPQLVLSEASRVARKKVLVTVPNEWEWPKEYKPFEHPEHKRFYTLDTLQDDLISLSEGKWFVGHLKDNAGWSFFVAELVKESELDELKEFNTQEFVLPFSMSRVVEGMKIVGPTEQFQCDGGYLYVKRGERKEIKEVIKIFAGMGFEDWSPTTIKELGSGGSEIAAYELAKRLKTEDNEVILYGEIDGVYDGVRFKHYSKFDTNYPCDVLISSRLPQMFHYDIPAKRKILWMHDADVKDLMNPQYVNKIDAIVCLSMWHKEYLKSVYPFLQECEVTDLNNYRREPVWEEMKRITYYSGLSCNRLPKMYVLGDGLNPNRFNQEVEKKKHRFIWLSSPDRGLLELLLLWPKIKSMFSDAELHIFYGWNFFNSRRQGKKYEDYKNEIINNLNQDGIYWRGRVGQKRMTEELMRADFNFYPLHPFPETFGMAFLESQAAGVICIARANGALGEIISDRGILLQKDFTEEQCVNAIADAEVWSDKFRRKGREWALQQTWDRVANGFREIINDI